MVVCFYYDESVAFVVVDFVFIPKPSPVVEERMKLPKPRACSIVIIIFITIYNCVISTDTVVAVIKALLPVLVNHPFVHASLAFLLCGNHLLFSRSRFLFVIASEFANGSCSECCSSVTQYPCAKRFKFQLDSHF